MTNIVGLEHITVRYQTHPNSQSTRYGRFAGLKRWLSGSHTFEALKDISLGIQKGEVFGLIGHNGAGKSTLLKLIARVLKPSSGRIWVNGRVAPLLELGAGFHPDLTGRENVLLNGALLGFTRRQMMEKFARIVDFAELWDFIDEPMRNYSSGMWARLGFAVATDTRPDILILDEILSVGDSAFQQKSSERIQQFRDQGATILMVSHNAMTIEAMCHRAAWLDHGVIKFLGSADEAVNQYRQYNASIISAQAKHGASLIDPAQRWGSRAAEITDVRLLDASGKPQETFQTGDSLAIEIQYSAPKMINFPIFGIAIHRQDGIHITGPNTLFSDLSLSAIHGQGSVFYKIPRLPLLNGVYRISAAIVNQDNNILDFHDRVYFFSVANTDEKAKEQFGLMTMYGNWEFN